MSAKTVLAASLLLLAGCATPAETAPAGSALAAACEGRDGWSDPAPPARIADNLYYVGTCGITVLLLTSPAGHIMIDGATEEAAPHIAANVERLGFSMRDIELIVSSHEHVDHVGGLAALKRLSGARLAARAEAKAVLESGQVDPADPQSGVIDGFTGVAVDQVVADGEVLRVGPLAIRAIATPGHTPGSTSWTWRACEAGACRTFVYADSLTAVSADAFRFSDYPELVARFRSTYGRVAALDCDMLITPHPIASNLFPRLAGAAPLADPKSCAAYADAARRRLDDRLAREAR